LHGAGPNPGTPNGWTSEPNATIYYSSLAQKKDEKLPPVPSVTAEEPKKAPPTVLDTDRMNEVKPVAPLKIDHDTFNENNEKFADDDVKRANRKPKDQNVGKVLDNEGYEITDPEEKATRLEWLKTHHDSA
jgi:hypothetical protein